MLTFLMILLKSSNFLHLKQNFIKEVCMYIQELIYIVEWQSFAI